MHPGIKKSLLRAPQLSSRQTENLNESGINQAQTNMIRNSNKVSLQDTRKTIHLKHRAPSYVSKLGIVPALPSNPFSSIHQLHCKMSVSLVLRGSLWRSRPGLHHQAAGKFSVRMHPQPICVPLILRINNAPSFHLLSGKRGSVRPGRLAATLPSLL